MEIVTAAIGGLIVLVVQGAMWLARQHRRRVVSGEIEASTLYLLGRRASLAGRALAIRRRLRTAADRQRISIEAEYVNDPLWQLNQIRIVPARTERGGNSARPITLESAVLVSHTGRIFLRGDSGSGKTSIIARTAAFWSQTAFGLRFDLATYDSDRSLLEQLGEGLLKPADVARGLALNEVTLFFDGLDTLPPRKLQMLDKELKRLFKRFPKFRLVVTSRPDTQPTRELVRATVYEVLPLTEKDIRDAVSSRAAQSSDLDVDELDEYVMQICSSPLALRMLLRAYGRDVEVPQNNAQLYRDFVNALLSHEETAVDAKLAVLSDLALHAENRIALRSQEVVRHLAPKLIELASSYMAPSGVDGSELLRELVADGVLRQEGSSVRFLHQSLQEYLAAVELEKRLSTGAMTIRAVCELATAAEWRNTIVFLSGVLSDATSLVAELRLKNRVLSAECIRSAACIDSALVDKCIAEALYEFKFGRMSFNYDLVFALAMIAHRRSNDLPDRIISEMDYWCAKYASRRLSVLPGLDDDELFEIVNLQPDSPQALDAAWTLGVRGVANAAPVLERAVRLNRSPLSRIAALSLGKIKEPRSAQTLLSMALSEDIEEPLRSACFNSIGMIGSKECLPAVVEFIRSERELDKTIRENAAWALIGLVDDYIVQSREFRQMLISQTTVGLPYARAMMCYLLGRFKIDDGLSQLRDLARDPTTDLLVLEDVIFAIGEFGYSEDTEMLKGLLSHPDSVVRARVVEALAKVGVPAVELASFVQDHESSELVRDAARGARVLEEKMRGLVPIDIRRRR